MKTVRLIEELENERKYQLDVTDRLRMVVAGQDARLES